jgi:limonene-1,2-epoxide hydrolase
MSKQNLDTRRRALLTGAAMAGLAAAFAPPLQAAAQTPREKAGLDVVNRFCAAWRTGDPATIGEFFDDAVRVRLTASVDTAMPVFDRLPATMEIAKHIAAGTAEFVVTESVAKGPIVVNRRIVKVTTATGTQNKPVVGVFFVRNGKIKEWHDFDDA